MTTSGAKRQPTNFQLAGKVARVVELEAVRLIGARLVTNPAVTEPETVKIDQQFKHTHVFVPEQGRLHVAVAFRLTMTEAADDADVSGAAIAFEGEFALDYSVPLGSSFNELELGYFAELNGTLNVWPYWRELVHSVIARTGMGAVTLPVWRATPKTLSPEELEAANASAAVQPPLVGPGS